MSEPYKRVGRGGAGNFYNTRNVENAGKAAEPGDIEAQSSPTYTAALAKTLSSTQPPPEYLHTGRGGAGNWISPAELSTQGLSQAQLASSTATEAPPKESVLSKPNYRGGRGGAGNYVDYVQEERLKKEQEEQTRKETQARIEKDVEVGLARPERAYAGPGGSFEMGGM